MVLSVRTDLLLPEALLILILTLMFCFAYLLSDIVYALLNPRIRVGGTKIGGNKK